MDREAGNGGGYVIAEERSPEIGTKNPASMIGRFLAQKRICQYGTDACWKICLIWELSIFLQCDPYGKTSLASIFKRQADRL